MDEESEILGGEEEEYLPPKKKIIYRIVGILIIIGMIYLTGINQALFYKKTPLGTPQENLESVLNLEAISVPLNIFVFRNDGEFGSDRANEDTEQIVKNASNILAQADIELNAKNVLNLYESD